MKTPLSPLSFASAELFRAWLAKNHAIASEILVRFYRLETHRGGVTYPEALDEAPCYGWIAADVRAHAGRVAILDWRAKTEAVHAVPSGVRPADAFRLARRAIFFFLAAMIFASRSCLARRCRDLFRVLVVAALLAVPASAKTRSHPTRSAELSDAEAYKGAIVTDAATGNVLFQDRADEISPPASMTKLMTFAVLYDKLASGAISLDTPVHIDNSDAKIGGTQVFLDPRETFSVEDLIYAMMIQSANDAAHALARASAGSVDAFVQLMNAKARELGMTHSTFRSPHGLPPSDRRLADGDLTTPRDYAVLCRYLLLRTDILRYTSVKERDFGPNRPKGPMRMINHNKLLGKVAGVDGLKTGYTEGAGYCLSATAERNGRRLIVVIMGSFGPHGQKDLGRTRDLKAIGMLERGFAIPATGDNFSAERAKFVKPAVIAIDANPAAGPDSNPVAAPVRPAAADDDAPRIKLALPHP